MTQTITVHELVTRFIAFKQLACDAGHFSAKAVEKLRQYLTSFAEHCGARPAAECRTSDVQSWVWSRPHYRSPHTKQDAISAVVSCWRWAEEESFIHRSLLRRPKGMHEPPKPRLPITPAEYRAMMVTLRRCDGSWHRSLPTRDALRLALCFLWRTGARTKEMRLAEWQDLDWQSGILRCWNKTGRVTGDERLIPLRRHLRRILQRVYQSRPRNNLHIFLNSRGGLWTVRTFARCFARVARLAGIRPRISPYCLRHGVCVKLIERGKSEQNICDVMGWRTTRYIHWYGRGSKTNADYLRSIIEP